MDIKVLSTLSFMSTPGRDVECSICLERFANVILTCGHAFCDIDIIDWQNRNQTCPICRESLTVGESYLDMEEKPEEIVRDIEKSLQNVFSYFDK